MNVTTIGIVGLRAAALAVTLAGKSSIGTALYRLADLAEAGVDVDEHMAEVAEKLKTGTVTDADWDDVLKRIDDDSARLQAGKS